MAAAVFAHSVYPLHAIHGQEYAINGRLILVAYQQEKVLLHRLAQGGNVLNAAVICNDQVIAAVREFPVHPQFPGGLEGQHLQQ